MLYFLVQLVPIGFNEDMVNEESKLNPLSIYAYTKMLSEQEVLKRNGTVFRLGTIYGLGDQFARIRADLVVNTLCIKSFVEGEITLNGGNQYRPLICVKNIANYVEENIRKKQKGIFNLGYKNVKIIELADEIKKVFPNVKLNITDQMFQDNRSYKVDFSKSRKHFEYVPAITVEQEIRELYTLLKEGRIKNPLNILYNNGLYLATQRI